MKNISTKEVGDTKAVQQYKRDIQALILANLTREEISECLGIDLNTTTRVTNKILEAVKKEGIDLFKATSASTRKALLFSATHDVLSGLLLSELFKTKRAIQGHATPPQGTDDPQPPSLRSKRSQTSGGTKPPTEAMLYNRLGLLVDLIRKNDKAYFETVGPMGVAAPGTHTKTEGPPHSPTNNNFGDLTELAALDELALSAKRKLAWVDRQRKKALQLDVEVEVIDE